MASKRVKVDGVIKMLLKKSKVFKRLSVRAMNNAGKDYIRYITERYYTGRPGLKVGEGFLRGAWRTKTIVTKDDIITIIAPTTPKLVQKYAMIHEKGGTIRPKKGQWLTIPVTQTAKNQVSARDMNLQFIPSKKAGTAVLIEPNTGTVHWVLKKSVDIPKRTNVEGDFPSVGARMFIAELEKVFKEVIKA